MRLRWLVLFPVAALLGLPLAAHAQPPESVLPWLHVAHPAGQRAQIVDPAGRTVILHGVNVGGIEDDFYRTPTGAEPGPAPMWPITPSSYVGTCPAMSHSAGEPPLCEVQAGLPVWDQSAAAGSHNDLAQIRALGFNVIRLTLSWSQLEPTPGVYSQTYLDRIAQVVGWAREQGIYVLLDMHEDNYSRYTPQTAPVAVPPLLAPTPESSEHADGAPPWAVITEGEPGLAVDGQGPLNAFVAAAFDSFWLNRVPTDASGNALPNGAAPGAGLQDHYIGAMATLARRFRGDSTVVGYDIMNEPLPGLFAPGPFSTVELYPFYRRVIDALTGAADGAVCPTGQPSVPTCGYRDLGVHVRWQSFFFEPMAVRNLDDAPDQLSLPFSSYPNLVYEPHTYTHVFTVDTMVGLSPSTSPYPISYDQAFQVADVEARSMGAALFSGEYGNNASDDDVILRGETAAQDRAGVGSTLWWWKGSCAAGTPQAACDASAWSMYEPDPAVSPAQNLELLSSRVKFVSRVVPRSVAGVLTSFAYDPDTHAFALAAVGAGAVAPGALDHETVVFIPSTVHGVVTAGGAAVLDRVVGNADGTRTVYVAPTGAGSYSVMVSPS